MVPLFALLVLVGCSSDPTEDLRGGPTELVATPTQLFIELGGTKTVEVGAVDAQGNPIDLAYEVSATGAGITVRRDLSFLPIFVDDSTLQAPAVGPRFRFIVEGTGYATTSFTVSAADLDITVPVQVVPQTGLAASFDNPTPALGEIVTLTAPAGVTFDPDAVLTIGEDTVTIVSQDASTISFIPPPSVNSPVTVNGVRSAGAPDVVFSPATDTPLQTPLIDTVDVTFSTTTPALGQIVTMTVVEPLINLKVDSIIFPGQLPGRQGDPQNIVVAPDSGSLTFAAPPNADGAGTVVNFAFPGGYLIPLPTRPNLVSTNIGLSLPATFSNIDPAVNEVVTVTAPPGFTFDDTTTVTVGANAGITVARAADGSSVNFVPFPGSIGIPQIDGVVPTASPNNIVIMPATATVTVPETIPVAPGTDDPATAPLLDTPPLNESSVLFDAPDFESTLDRIYKIDITEAGTYRITMDWTIGDDVDMFLCPTEAFAFDSASDPTDDDDPANCNFAGATGAHPESVPFVLQPGDYWIWADDFGQAVGAASAIDTRLTLIVRHTALPPPPPPLTALQRAAPSDLRKLRRLETLRGLQK